MDENKVLDKRLQNLNEMHLCINAFKRKIGHLKEKEYSVSELNSLAIDIEIESLEEILREEVSEVVRKMLTKQMT